MTTHLTMATERWHEAARILKPALFPDDALNPQDMLRISADLVRRYLVTG